MLTHINNSTNTFPMETSSLFSFYLIDVIFKELAIRNPLTLKAVTVYSEDDFDDQILEKVVSFLSITYHPWILIGLEQWHVTMHDNFELSHKPFDLVHLFLINGPDGLAKIRLKDRLILSSNNVIIGFRQNETREHISSYFDEIVDPTVNATSLMRVIFVTLNSKGNPTVRTFNLGDEEKEDETDLRMIKLPKVDMMMESISVYMVTRLPKAINIERDPNDPTKIVFSGRDGMMASFLANYFNASLHYKVSTELAMQDTHNISEMSNVEFTKDETGPL